MASSATPYQSLCKIPGQVGFLILNEEGAVILSNGELQNEDRMAKLFFKMANRVKATNMEPIKRIVVCFENHFYAVGLSNKKYVIVKRLIESLDTEGGNT